MIDSATICYLNKIGEAVLIETLKDAAFFLLHSDGRTSRHYKEGYTYINGTGLDVIINSYGLDYDPSQIRTSFFFHMRRSS